MTQPPQKPPSAPAQADKLKARENALRDNLLKRKQQQRARTAAPAPDSDPSPASKGK